jgi:hypothetical protein
MKEFRKQDLGEPVTIKLTRAQIQQMNEMVDHFKDQNEFELKYQNDKLYFNFTVEFDK